MGTKSVHSETIGVIDSGVGGITVWAEVVRLLPGCSTVYFADTANCPYGGRGDDEIVELTRHGVQRLVRYGVGLIVLACNTITAAAVDILRVEYPDTIFVGMEPAVKPAALATKTGVVGILATRATLRGRLYQDTSHRWAEGVRLIEIAGDGLVEMVEEQRVGTPQCDALLLAYITPMLEAGADQVVLGCTHYPFLSESIIRLTGGKLQVVEPAKAVARRVEQLLEQTTINTVQQSVQHRFLSSSTNQEEPQKIERMAWQYYNK